MPKLTEPPARVFAKRVFQGAVWDRAHWWVWVRGLRRFVRYDCEGVSQIFSLPKNLQLVDHPKNDPEAVAIINAARPVSGEAAK